MVPEDEVLASPVLDLGGPLSQFPGMQRDLVRYTLELTWSPGHGEIQLSRRVWTKPLDAERWQLEDIRVSRPMTHYEASDAGHQWVEDALAALVVVEHLHDPFP